MIDGDPLPRGSPVRAYFLQPPPGAALIGSNMPIGNLTPARARPTWEGAFGRGNRQRGYYIVGEVERLGRTYCVQVGREGWVGLGGR